MIAICRSGIKYFYFEARIQVGAARYDGKVGVNRWANRGAAADDGTSIKNFNCR